MPENLVTISTTEYAALVAAAKEADMLKRILGARCYHYAPLQVSDLKDICVMFGIDEEKDDEE